MNRRTGVVAVMLSVTALCAWVVYVLHEKGACEREGGAYIPSANACVEPIRQDPEEPVVGHATSNGITFGYADSGRIVSMSALATDGRTYCYRPTRASNGTLVAEPTPCLDAGAP
jgi:hypothetical protein